MLSLPRLPPPTSTLSPYTTLFRSRQGGAGRCRRPAPAGRVPARLGRERRRRAARGAHRLRGRDRPPPRSEEHTSELQSHVKLVCRLLLEKKNQLPANPTHLPTEVD